MSKAWAAVAAASFSPFPDDPLAEELLQSNIKAGNTGNV
jgi:hypothetical protein